MYCMVLVRRINFQILRVKVLKGLYKIIASHFKDLGNIMIIKIIFGIFEANMKKCLRYTKFFTREIIAEF